MSPFSPLFTEMSEGSVCVGGAQKGYSAQHKRCECLHQTIGTGIATQKVWAQGTRSMIALSEPTMTSKGERDKTARRLRELDDMMASVPASIEASYQADSQWREWTALRLKLRAYDLTH